MRRVKTLSLRYILLFAVILLSNIPVNSQSQQQKQIPLPNVTLNIGGQNDDEPSDYVLTLQIIAVMTVLTLAPSILIMMTSFTRIIIVFHFLKSAIGTQNQPPNQLLTGLALFLTFFVMQPVLDEVNTEGIQPYLKKQINQEQAVENVVKPFREFMLKHTREEDLALFIKLNGSEKPTDISDVSTWTIIPAFSISELRIAFQIGFLVFIPFLVLDMVIASVLMSLGMFLLPPQLISLPIKVLLFVLVDGWYLIVDSLMKSILSG